MHIHLKTMNSLTLLFLKRNKFKLLSQSNKLSLHYNESNTEH